MEWYLKVLRQYADFKGRARRKEYWMFTLFNVIILVLLAIIDALLWSGSGPGDAGPGILQNLYSLAVLVPSIAVAARRLHDIGRSGWWQLIGIIPIIGWIILIVWLATDGKPEPNQWGANPKATTSAPDAG